MANVLFKVLCKETKQMMMAFFKNGLKITIDNEGQENMPSYIMLVKV